MRTQEWALIMTGSTLTVLPLIVVFLFTQRYFIRGVAMSGLKG
jgi:multiple sugar transport system permease protein